MFGYVRPDKGELKVREYESFKSAYCGLCHALRRNYGIAARFIVNYDLTFLAMLLSLTETPCWEYKRCMVSPRKKRCLCGVAALDSAAGYSVILAYWKLRDTVQDDGFLKASGARISMLMLRSAYKKAERNCPDFAAATRENLIALKDLEERRCPSIDMAADKFAGILESAANDIEPEPRRRAMKQLLYHTGRIVYLLDAVADLGRDVKDGAYNPLIYRFSCEGGKLSEGDLEAVAGTVRNSQGFISSAFELLDTGPWTDILSNIIYGGIPKVAESVMSGNWPPKKERGESPA